MHKSMMQQLYRQFTKQEKKSSAPWSYLYVESIETIIF